jgi:hypothetical protein
MALSNEQLDMLEQAGEALLDISQAATIIEIDSSWLTMELGKKDSLAHKRYYKGYYLSLLKVRKSIIDLAARGSFPAQQLLQKIIEKQG